MISGRDHSAPNHSAFHFFSLVFSSLRFVSALDAARRPPEHGPRSYLLAGGGVVRTAKTGHGFEAWLAGPAGLVDALLEIVVGQTGSSSPVRTDQPRSG